MEIVIIIVILKAPTIPGEPKSSPSSSPSPTKRVVIISHVVFVIVSKVVVIIVEAVLPERDAEDTESCGNLHKRVISTDRAYARSSRRKERGRRVS